MTADDWTRLLDDVVESGIRAKRARQEPLTAAQEQWLKDHPERSPDIGVHIRKPRRFTRAFNNKFLGHMPVFFWNTYAPIVILFHDNELEFTWKQFHRGKLTVMLFWRNKSSIWWMRYGIRICYNP